MREKRNELRPVSISSLNIKGYLHYIGQNGNLEDGIEVVALIEDENGKMNEVNAYDLKFDDIELK